LLVNDLPALKAVWTYLDPEYDKYTFDQEAQVDCESRLAVCKAVCCKLPFALSKQDVEEGIIRWEFGRPYLIAHGEDGYCVHMDRNTFKCTVRENRTVPCRGFDCRDNEKWKIWVDYEKGMINPELVEKVDREIEVIYNCSLREPTSLNHNLLFFHFFLIERTLLLII